MCRTLARDTKCCAGAGSGVRAEEPAAVIGFLYATSDEEKCFGYGHYAY